METMGKVPSAEQVTRVEYDDDGRAFIDGVEYDEEYLVYLETLRFPEDFE